MKQDLAIVQMTHPFELRVWNIHDPAERERELGEKERRRAERYKQAYLFEIVSFVFGSPPHAKG